MKIKYTCYLGAHTVEPAWKEHFQNGLISSSYAENTCSLSVQKLCTLLIKEEYRQTNNETILV